jgi:hypothetical protein
MASRALTLNLNSADDFFGGEKECGMLYLPTSEDLPWLRGEAL